MCNCIIFQISGVWCMFKCNNIIMVMYTCRMMDNFWYVRANYQYFYFTNAIILLKKITENDIKTKHLFFKKKSKKIGLHKIAVFVKTTKLSPTKNNGYHRVTTRSDQILYNSIKTSHWINILIKWRINLIQ